jgi:acetaldehyde dehydrogenase/alcohol dehydrogenase
MINIAHEKFQNVAGFLGLPASTTDEAVKSLGNAIRSLMKELNIPATIKECGIEEQAFLSRVDYLADRAFEDQCTGANPRMPLVSELKDLYLKAYYGK